MKPKKVVDVRLVKVSFGKKRARAPKAFYNPVPPNKRLVEPFEQEQFRKDLEPAHAATLASDTSGNVQWYGSSTWLTALQTNSDSSSGSESDEVDNECDTSDSSSDEHRALYVTEATWSSPEELYKTCVCVTEERAKDIEVPTRGQSSSTSTTSQNFVTFDSLHFSFNVNCHTRYLLCRHQIFWGHLHFTLPEGGDVQPDTILK